MTILEELQTGSFKGESFLISSSNVSGGRKDVKQEYPNSDKQKIEDLGLKPRSFELTVVIAGDNYLQDRDRFLSVLDEGGPGILIHPFYGKLNKMVARSFTILETIGELGIGRINILFDVDNSSGIPQVTANTLSKIQDLNDSVIGQLNASLVETYKVTPSASNSFSDAVIKLNSVVSGFNSNTDVLQASADKIDAFNSQLSSLQSNVISLVQSPKSLADNIDATFSLIDSLYPVVEDTISVLAGLFSFGLDDIPLILDTFSRIERDKNRGIVNAVMQASALGYSYFNTAQIKFETVLDIDTRSDALEVQYKKTIDLPYLNELSRDSIKNLRTEMQHFFESQKINARQLITINTNLTSARLLSYKYYGESNQDTKIIEINGIQDPSFIEGDIKVLTE